MFFTITSTLVCLWAMYFDATGKLKFFNDPWILLDCCIIGLLTYGIYKKSRFAAFSMVVYFIISKIVLYHEIGKGIGVVSFIMLIIFIMSTYGTFKYHHIKKQTDPNYKKFNKKLYWVTIPSSLIFFVFLAFAILLYGGIMPETKVIKGNEISSYQWNILIDEGIIVPEDSIIYFYSAGFLSVKEDGQLFTSNKVVTYWTENDTLFNVTVNYNDIKAIDVVQRGSWLEDSIIELQLFNGDYLYLTVSAENGLDSLFYIEMVHNWESVQNQQVPSKI